MRHWDEHPIVLVDGVRVRAVSLEAGRQRIRAGMTTTEASSRCATLVVLPWDEPVIADAVQAMTAALVTASPQVSPAPGMPGTWWVGASGFQSLGGEPELARVLQAIATRRYGQARVGIADSCVAARAATWEEGPRPRTSGERETDTGSRKAGSNPETGDRGTASATRGGSRREPPSRERATTAGSVRARDPGPHRSDTAASPAPAGALASDRASRTITRVPARAFAKRDGEPDTSGDHPAPSGTGSAGGTGDLARTPTHASRPPVLVPPGQCAAYLARVPLGLIPMGEELRETLSALGIRSGGGLAALTVEDVERRWGPEGVQAWQLARGNDPRRPGLSRLEQVRMVSLDVLPSVETTDPLLFLVRAALDRLTSELVADGRAAAVIAISLTLDDRRGRWLVAGGGTRAHTITREVRLSRPLARVVPLLERCRALLEGWALSAPVCGIAVAVTATAPLHGAQGELLDPAWRDPGAAEAAFARLRAELGQGAIVRPVANDVHRPEDAGRWEEVELDGAFPGRRESGGPVRKSAVSVSSNSATSGSGRVPPAHREGGAVTGAHTLQLVAALWDPGAPPPAGEVRSTAGHVHHPAIARPPHPLLLQVVEGDPAVSTATRHAPPARGGPRDAGVDPRPGSAQGDLPARQHAARAEPRDPVVGRGTLVAADGSRVAPAEHPLHSPSPLRQGDPECSTEGPAPAAALRSAPHSPAVAGRTRTGSALPERLPERLAASLPPAATPPALRQPDHPERVSVECTNDVPRAIVWRGRRLRIRRTTGPERLAGDWWTDPYARDYWRCEDADSAGALVIYRDGREADAWYVQGWYD